MNKRMVAPDKRKLRNLVQYRDMGDEEFDEVFESQFEIPYINETDVEEAVEEKIKQLGEDYDLDDMKINDRNLLRSLALAEIQLEYIERTLFAVRQEESYTINNVTLVEKLNRIAVGLRSDINSISDTLAISRKERRKDQETSVQDALDNLRQRARAYAERSMVHVFCPKCQLLLLSAWLQVGNKESKLETSCPRCQEPVELTLEDLYKTENKNLEDVKLP